MAIAVLAWLVAIPVLGAMTGLRSMTPIAVLCWFSYAGHLDVYDTWGFWTARLIPAVVFTILAVGEFIGDKLPWVPSRISAFPLIARATFGGLVGALAATGLYGSLIEGAFLGAISAIAGAFLGFHLRHWLVEEHRYPDLPVALAEDVLAVSLSVLAMGIVTG